MKLTPAIDPWEAAIDTATREHAEYLHGAIHALNRAYEHFWSLSSAELLTRLNDLGPERVGAIMAAHNAQAVAVNSALEAALVERSTLAARLNVRAITVPALNIQWDADAGAFVLIVEADEAEGSEE